MNEASTGGSRPVVPAERRRLIFELLKSKGAISVRDVEQQFDVSPMTARRDLAQIAASGLAQRTHGGAMMGPLAGHEDSFQNRVEHEVEAKLALARAVCADIGAGETVFVDSSSTAYYVVRELIARAVGVTLLTNSLPVINLATTADAVELDVIGLGGAFRALSRSFVGADTLRMIRGFAADCVIFSAKGIEADGSLTDPDPLEADVKRAMINQAHRVFFAAESRKFEQRGLNIVTAANQLSTAYLQRPPESGVRAFTAAGVEVRKVS